MTVAPMPKPGSAPLKPPKPGSFQEIPKTHAGRVQPPPKKTQPKTTIRSAPAAPPQTSIQGAQDLFRTTLAQIRALQTPVDHAAILKPYQDASVAAGQLGTGLTQAVQQSGQAAQDQYARGRDQATAQGAAFGISAGAGADSMVRPGELAGNSLLAQQTAAQTAAASGAASAWQSLLGRMGASADSKATADRATADNQVATSLAGNIPTWAQNADTLNFQKDTARKNYLLAMGTAHDKRSNDLRNYLLDVQKTGNTANYQQGLLDIGNRNAATGETRTQAQIDANNARVAHWGDVEKRLNTAARNKGLATGDVSQILKTLKGPAGKGAKTITGYKITRIATDPSAGQIPGTQFTYTAGVDKPQMEPGWSQVGIGEAKYATGSPDAAKFSWSRYKAATNLAMQLAKQRGVTLTRADIVQMLGPTPKTGK